MTPKKKYEDKDEEITFDDLTNKFLKNTIKYDTWDYDKNIFIDKHNEFNKINNNIIPEYNYCYQQPYRYLSYQYHVKKSLELLNINELSDDDVIFLSRLDNGIIKINYTKINELLQNHDVIVEKKHSETLRKKL